MDRRAGAPHSGALSPDTDVHAMTSADESNRLLALHSLALLDTPPEPAFDGLVQAASYVCGTPIALVSLVDRARQWFKARTGLDATETPREHAFCSHAIQIPDGLIVRDATQDPRFSTNPLVVDSPGIRFYAGIPIRTAGDIPIGTLCVIDTVPRTLTERQLQVLRSLALQVEHLIALHYANRTITALSRRQRQIERHLREVEIHEARRIAAELHDGLGQQLTAVNLAVGVLQSRVAGQSEAAAEQVATVGLLVSEAIRQCRDLAYSEATFTVEERGLVGFLQRYCTLLNEGPGAPITLSAAGLLARDLDSHVSHHLFRIAQEAIVNARRHGEATRIGVEIVEQPDLLTLTIDDDGKGISGKSRSFPGLGIRSMQFRAEEIGARIDIADRHYGGTQVRCELPLQAPGLEARSNAAAAGSRIRRA